MAKLSLPPTDSSLASTLRDVDAARTWLATQSLAQPLKMIRALLQEIHAVDASVDDPAVRMDILSVLHAAVLQAQEGVAVRYAHKPLPLLNDELTAFEQSRELWMVLAVAYLRAAPLLPPSQMLLALYRGAVSLRESLYCHYLAGIEIGTGTPKLMMELLAAAESLNVQRVPVNDSDYGVRKDACIAGEIAWAILLGFCDPYHFTPAQLTVTNRALSRWCDLASFQAQPDEDQRHSKAIPLERWAGLDILIDGGPKWLDVRPVIRKIRKRVESLEAGETPEQLRLGRELSPVACMRLMNELDQVLRPKVKASGDRLSGATIDLVFSHEHLYTLLSGKSLEARELSSKSTTISHERLGVFGFDNAAARTDIVTDLRAPAESWAIEEHWVLRAAPAGNQVISPLLVGIRPQKEGGTPQLAVLFGLRQTGDGWLAAQLRILPAPAACGILNANLPAAMKGTSKPQPAFLIPGDSDYPVSICLPTGLGSREGSLMSLSDSPVEHLRLGEVIERGSNFVRFTYART